jgi:small subunit ribosomal protein S16
MLSIRMQRIGRKGHPTYRVVVQDSRWAPTSGRFVAQLGSYDPHTKTTTLVKEKAELYLKNGAQPSERVVRLLSREGVKMPKWVEKPSKQKREIRNPDKLRRNRPAEPEAKEAPKAESEEATAEVPVETVAEESTGPSEKPKESTPPTKSDEFPEDSGKPEEPAEKDETEVAEVVDGSKKLEKESKEKA